jgi:hypothetical protein
MMVTLGRVLACWVLAATAANARDDGVFRVLHPTSAHTTQSLVPQALALAQTPASSLARTRVPDQTIRLEITDTGQERRRPESGWCGEAAIQMALSYYGAYASQQAINRAGKPEHADLYAHEIPRAMRKLGLEYVAWKGDGLEPYLAWIRGQLADARPVLVGVKIYPTAHPEWALDHFMLAVGCTGETLTYNTTWGRQETKTLAGLSVQEKGLSFANRFDTYYGYAITGLKTRSARGDLKPTRITIGRDGDQQIKLRLSIEKLERGKRYRLLKFTDLAAVQQSDADGDLVRSFVADGPSAHYAENIGIDDARVYRCVPER